MQVQFCDSRAVQYNIDLVDDFEPGSKRLPLLVIHILRNWQANTFAREKMVTVAVHYRIQILFQIT